MHGPFSKILGGRPPGPQDRRPWCNVLRASRLSSAQQLVRCVISRESDVSESYVYVQRMTEYALHCIVGLYTQSHSLFTTVSKMSLDVPSHLWQIQNDF